MSDDDINPQEWLPDDVPIINKHRLSQPDMAIDLACRFCGGSGQTDKHRCRNCKGKGRVLSRDGVEEIIADEKMLSDVRFAQAQVRNILNYLYQKKIITEQNVHDGRTFEIWKEIHDSSFSMRKKSYYGALRAELAAEGLSEMGYVLILKKLSVYHHNAISMAISTIQSPWECERAVLYANTYKSAFVRLTELIPEIQEELQKYSEMTTEQKEHLKRTRLEELLATFKGSRYDD